MEIEMEKVDNAIIIAAGFGSRFVPLTFETPKGLLNIMGENMIERQIKQLHQVGIHDITIVVGYLKEKFEYLTEKYQVKLIYNPDYRVKNNLSSLYYARHLMKNTYLLCSDNWIVENMFHPYEDKSWYSCIMKEGKTDEWCIETDENKRITGVTIGGEDALVMYGAVYFSREFSEKMVPLLEEYYQMPGTDHMYWENVLIEHLKELEIYINEQKASNVYEFENLEELRRFDGRYRNCSGNAALECIARVFHIKEDQIIKIQCVKSDLIKKAFTFVVEDRKYMFIFEEEKELSGTSIEKMEKEIYYDAETGYHILKNEGMKGAE
jgi:CTP:phosphocholine cytidylyltransferase-like protein